MKDKIIFRIKNLIEKTEQEEAKEATDRIAKNNKLIGLYEALNAVYDVFIEESK